MGVQAHRCPHLLVIGSHGDSCSGLLEVGSHAHHPMNPRTVSLFDDLGSHALIGDVAVAVSPGHLHTHSSVGSSDYARKQWRAGLDLGPSRVAAPHRRSGEALVEQGAFHADASPDLRAGSRHRRRRHDSKYAQ